MRYSIIIDVVKTCEWGLNSQQSCLFSWFTTLPTWADKIIHNGEVYYFASKNKAIQDLPFITEKVDTMYRLYKQLEELELIKTIKFDSKDYVCFLKKASEWNSFNRQKNDNQSEYSEKNPSEVGKKSDFNSEKNQTYYKEDIINNTITNNIYTSKKISKKVEQEKLVFGEHQNVFLTLEEAEKIKLQRGGAEFDAIVDKLSNYKLASGKKYKSDYGAINTWVIESVKTNQNKQSNGQVSDNKPKPKSNPHLKPGWSTITGDEWFMRPIRVPRNDGESN